MLESPHKRGKLVPQTWNKPQSWNLNHDEKDDLKVRTYLAT